MERQAVQSSNIASVGYDSTTQALEIEFSNGSVYQYQNVHKSLYIEFVGSKSLGGFFAAKIKPYFAFTATGASRRQTPEERMKQAMKLPESPREQAERASREQGPTLAAVWELQRQTVQALRAILEELAEQTTYLSILEGRQREESGKWPHK